MRCSTDTFNKGNLNNKQKQYSKYGRLISTFYALLCVNRSFLEKRIFLAFLFLFTFSFTSSIFFAFIVLAENKAYAGQYELSAKEITITNKNITARKNATFRTGNTVMSGEYLTYNNGTSTLTGHGNVKAVINTNNVQGEYVEYNTRTKSVNTNNTTIFYAPYYYIYGDKIDSQGSSVYNIKGGIFSTCNLTNCSNNPPWSVRFSSGQFENGEYVSGTNVRLNVKYMPVLYAPYFILPVKNSRQSGFLIPNFGESNLLGTYIAPTYFYAIGPDRDFTGRVVHYSVSGEQFIVEYRYAVSEYESVYLSAENIQHKRYMNSKVYQSYLHNRWRYISKTSVNLFSTDITLKANMDYASDPRYMTDYSTNSLYQGSTTASSNDFYVQVQLEYSTSFMNAYIYDYYHNQKAGDLVVENNKITDERSLIVTKDIYTGWWINYRYYIMGSDVTYHDYDNNFQTKKKNYNMNVSYHRVYGNLDFYQSIYFQDFTVTPTVSLIGTGWTNYQYTTNDATSNLINGTKNKSEITRLTYKLDNVIELQPFYRYLTNDSILVLRNNLEYEYLPKINQTSMPNIIEYDHLVPVNALSYSNIIQYLQNDMISTSLKSTIKYDYYKEKYEPLKERFELYTPLLTDKTTIKYDWIHDNQSVPYVDQQAMLSYDRFYVSGNYYYDNTINVTGNTKYNTMLQASTGINLYYFKLDFTQSEGGKNFQPTTDNLNLMSKGVTFTLLGECYTLYISKTDKYNRPLNKPGVHEIYYVLGINLQGIGAIDRQVNLAGMF